MADRILGLNRRELLAGLSAAAIGPAVPGIAAAAGQALTLQAKAGAIALRPGQPDTPIWSLQGALQNPGFRFKQGDQLKLAFGNELPVPALLNWYGLDGVPAAEPLAARPPLAPGARENLVIPLRHAGTLLCDISLLGDGQARPARPQALIVAEREPVTVDRDEVFLVEDWRLRADGTAVAPGSDPSDMVPLYTVNGQVAPDFSLRRHERLRFRFINGCQRAVIAVKIEGYEVRVMALDGQPSEPFPARNSAIVLAPGSRADAFIDASGASGSTPILLHDGKEARPVARLTVANEPPLRDAGLPPAQPLPSNGLPALLDLKSALRVDVALGEPQADWVRPANFAIASAPAFRAKAGRTVVLALSNRGDKAVVFHLHGHHFRLLDRLDDGWKPFWLDTLGIDSGQTQRIAFAADYPGRWLMEAAPTDWAAPRLVRWFSVE